MIHRFVPVLLLAASCAPAGDELSPVEGLGDHRPSNAIYGGSAATASYHGAVVALHQRSGGSVYTTPFCTGTLIADDVVLTAAHCLDTAGGGKRYSTMSPSSLAIYVGDDPSVDLTAHLYTVTETLIHTSYDRNALLNDIAIVRLGAAVTEESPVQNLPASRGFTTSDVGMAVNFAGFGQAEDGSSGVKLAVDSELGGLGCTVSGCWDPGDAATQVSYEQGASVGGPCFGDSGGPMFVDRSGTTYVAGVTSYGDSRCLQYGVSTRVDAFESWIDSFVGTSGGGGDTGASGGGSCGDGVCDAGESCDGRDGTAACSDCDGRTTGKPALRYCEVEGVCVGAGCP